MALVFALFVLTSRAAFTGLKHFGIVFREEKYSREEYEVYKDLNPEKAFFLERYTDFNDCKIEINGFTSLCTTEKCFSFSIVHYSNFRCTRAKVKSIIT